MSNLNVMIGMDMETDVGSFTPFYEGLVHGTPILLDVMNKREVTGTFYFTGDSVKQHPEVADQVKSAGHEIGCHTLFHETIGDAVFPVAGMPPILPEEVPHRLEVATQWIEHYTGVRPVSFRAPRLFGSTSMINALENLGYATDASYPMYFFRDRLVPYHPHRDDWTKEGELSIVELPNFANLSLESTDPHGRDMDQWPLFRTEGADALLEHIDGFIGYCQEAGQTPFLCFYFHPWEFWPMPRGDIRFGEGHIRPEPFIVKNCGPEAVKQFDRLLTALKEREAVFLQAKDFANHI